MRGWNGLKFNKSGSLEKYQRLHLAHKQDFKHHLTTYPYNLLMKLVTANKTLALMESQAYLKTNISG
jgi:hypothetical protein